MQFFCNFNKKTSTAVPLWNAQSPLEQIVRSEAKIRKVRRIFEMCKYKEQRASSISQNYSKLFFLRVLFIGSEYYSRHGRTIRAREI